MSLHGASLSTLVHRSKGYSSCILVVRDNGGGIFGALLADELKPLDRDKYYGNGSNAVWSFSSGSLKV